MKNEKDLRKDLPAQVYGFASNTFPKNHLFSLRRKAKTRDVFVVGLALSLNFIQFIILSIFLYNILYISSIFDLMNTKSTFLSNFEFFHFELTDIYWINIATYIVGVIVTPILFIFLMIFIPYNIYYRSIEREIINLLRLEFSKRRNSGFFMRIITLFILFTFPSIVAFIDRHEFGSKVSDNLAIKYESSSTHDRLTILSSPVDLLYRMSNEINTTKFI